jgi:anthranilate synthase component I
MLRKALRIRDDPLGAFRKVAAGQDRAFLFQSAEGPRRLAEYSMVGFAPAASVTLDGTRWEVDGDAPLVEGPKPSDALRGLLRHGAAGADLGYRYLGGLVGYVGYEYAARIEEVPAHRDGPVLDMGLYLDGIVFDHVRGQVFYFSHGKDRSALVEAALAKPAQPGAVQGNALASTPDQPRFEAMVRKAKEHIREGDVFQVVLSKKVQGRLEGDPLTFYEHLLRRNPSPYMYCLRSGERTIVGSSPEMLVRVQQGKVETYPIAGTRPLGETPAETEALAADLKADPKERAEHAMLVDLARNDVGRVSAYGTVQVHDPMHLERFSHVQHMVSRVEGRLAPGKDALDAFDALFPAGTVSGAPKVRAMEIIHDLEGQARGPYAGAVGYFGLNGSLDAAITIRTLVADRDRLTVQSGAGIVADSDPAKEWAETEAKARALVGLLQDPEVG